MGVDSSTYVGVYLVIPHKKVKRTNSQYVDANGNPTSNKFDPNNGKENKLVTSTKDGIEEPWPEFSEYESLTEDEIDSLSDDEFWRPQYMATPKNTSIFILNGKSKYRLADEDDEATIELNSVDIPILLNDFSVEYKKYLDAIKKEYESVEVKFGVIHYYN